jgi:aerobic-type carbon monoxide dehydrogenase small subunit (CoxS/CutS family)
MMAAKALLDQNPNPTLKDVHHGLSGNFCRCGTYAGMRQAVLAAAAADAADNKKDDKKGPPKEPKGVAHG